MSRVIVLDDSEIMRSVLSEIVSFMGYEVSAFGKVAPFLEQVRCHPAERIIVDASLGGNLNGLDIIEQIRHLAGMEGSQYILMTANPAMAPLRERSEQRKIKLLGKPCSFEDLEIALV